MTKRFSEDVRSPLFHMTWDKLLGSKKVTSCIFNTVTFSSSQVGYWNEDEKYVTTASFVRGSNETYGLQNRTYIVTTILVSTIDKEDVFMFSTYSTRPGQHPAIRVVWLRLYMYRRTATQWFNLARFHVSQVIMTHSCHRKKAPFLAHNTVEENKYIFPGTGCSQGLRHVRNVISEDTPCLWG